MEEGPRKGYTASWCIYCRLERNSMPEHLAGCPNSALRQLPFDISLSHFQLGREHRGEGYQSDTELAKEYPSYALGFMFPNSKKKMCIS